jgi:hypothetical protein
MRTGKTKTKIHIEKDIDIDMCTCMIISLWILLRIRKVSWMYYKSKHTFYMYKIIS